MQELVDKLWSVGRSLLANVVVIDQADSTHSMALRLIEQMDEEGMQLEPTLLLALSQSHGRGRSSSLWLSPPGGLYLNWICSSLASETVTKLPVVAAAAAHQAVAEIGVASPVIKWPNDLLVRNRKLAGVLVHARHTDSCWATIGLGVNLVTAPEIGPEDGLPAISVSDCLAGIEIDDLLPRLALGFVELLHEHLQRIPAALTYWRDHLLHREGEAMALRLGSGELERGTCAGFTDEGFLRLLTPTGEKIITSGELTAATASG